VDNFYPGLVVLLGSGETQPSSGNTHEYIAENLSESPHIAILETPAGFELNSESVAGKIREFLEVRLQNFKPKIIQIAARKKGTKFSPDNFEIVEPLLYMDEILLGPGSPTYAVRQLKESLAFEMIRARHRIGAALVLSSAATLAFGRYTIPVYEIFKVGEDPHWKNGLDFWKPFGLNLSVVPHWNNNDGGNELDTSRCYIGQSRFEQLSENLPCKTVILGIDDHTSVVLDLREGICRVMGKGTVHVLKDGKQIDFPSGETFDIQVLGDFTLPPAGDGISPQVWQQAVSIHQSLQATKREVPDPPQAVLSILEERKTARDAEDWGRADVLRKEIEKLGWKVMDTAQGAELVPLENNDTAK
jgi:hypothetical protein